MIRLPKANTKQCDFMIIIGEKDRWNFLEGESDTFCTTSGPSTRNKTIHPKCHTQNQR